MRRVTSTALYTKQLDALPSPASPEVRGPSKLGMEVRLPPRCLPVRAAARGEVMRALARSHRHTQARAAHATAVLMHPSTHGEARQYPGFSRRTRLSRDHQRSD